jgi:HEPN domain-containing protein
MVDAIFTAILEAMPNRSHDSPDQAQRDLEQAEASRRDGRHEWACFAAQQAAELAAKALHQHLGQEARGHVIARLLRQLAPGVRAPDSLVEKAHVLDGFYVPPRYPNSHAEGPPFEHYGPLQSEEAIGYAREIVEFARAQMA